MSSRSSRSWKEATMRIVAILVALSVGMAGVAIGQQSVATATSSATFQLKGAPVNPSGVPNWPVNAGDEVVAGTAPVTLTFADGSKISLAPGSKCVVGMEGGKPTFRLTGGEALYDLKTTGGVKLYALNRVVQPSGLQGEYNLGGGAKAASFWTPAHKALVGVVVVGTGVGVGVAVAKGKSTPAPVSPR